MFVFMKDLKFNKKKTHKKTTHTSTAENSIDILNSIQYRFFLTDNTSCHNYMINLYSLHIGLGYPGSSYGCLELLFLISTDDKY